MRSQQPKPHPLAGRVGEGPPLAPERWKWRAGNRIGDMYFRSPSGQTFRSQPQLTAYLQSLTDPPHPSQFCWRVTPSVWNGGPLPGSAAPTRAKRKSHTVMAANKRAKVEKDDMRQVSNGSKDLLNSAEAFESPPNFSLPDNLKPSMSHKLPRRRKPHHERLRVARSFRSILTSKSSFLWLRDPIILRNFLRDAQELSDIKIKELQKVLQSRDLELANLSKYTSSVLRVFVRLLRNKDAPLSMGRLELANLCVDWRCKHKSFWCLLEMGKMDAAAATLSQADHLHINGIGNPELGVESLVSGISNQIEMVDSGKLNEIVDEKGSDNVKAVREKEMSVNVGPAENPVLILDNRELSSSSKMKAACPTERMPGDSSVANLSIPPEQTSSERRGEEKGIENKVAREIEDNVQLQRRVDSGVGSDRGGFRHQDSVVSKQNQGMSVSSKPHQVSNEVTVCLCRMCESDAHFCRGCMCSFCKGPVMPGEDQMVLKCPQCQHICHVDCMQMVMNAGTKDTDLGREVTCPTCTQKVDLLPFLRKALESSLLQCQAAGSQAKMLESLLLSASQLSKVSECCIADELIMESHEILTKCSLFPQLERILCGALQHSLPPVRKSDAEDSEVTLSAMQKPQVVKALEFAKIQRTLMEKAVGTVEHAYGQALDEVENLACLSRRRLSEKSKYLTKGTVTEEQIHAQRIRVQEEKQRLSEIQHLGAATTKVERWAEIDKRTGLWLDSLKAQRKVVAAAEAELLSLECAK